MRKSIEALGHRVTFVQEAPRAHRDLERHVRAGVDLVLYTRTDSIGLDSAGARRVWDLCLANGTPTASLHLDLFFGLDRRGVKVTTENPLFGTQFVFTADGDHDAEFAAAGVNHIWLPPGVFHEECYVGASRAEYAGDAAFVGSSNGYHRQHPRRKELVAALETHYAGRFTRAGDGRTVREGALNDLYASVKVSAGDSLAPRQTASMYWSDRCAEAPGRGSILVHPMMDAAYDQFGDHIVWCGWDVADQIAAMDDVLAWPEAMRAGFIREAVEFVRENHSYRNRISTVLDSIGLT